MISRTDIEQRSREWSLSEEVVEKDYVLGWVLWGVGTEPAVAEHWAFKGGTCIKKCYLETYRFSEDLDFTVLPEGLVLPDELAPVLRRLLARVTEASGIDFSRREPLLKGHASGKYTEGRIYYIGPRQTPDVAKVQLDLSASEIVVRPTIKRPIAHAYPDSLPEPGMVLCYSFEEVFAEKIRALGERGRPRDLYDVVNLFRRQDLGVSPAVIASVLDEKCRTKGVPVPTAESVLSDTVRAELESEWQNMLGHQLPALPPLRDFLREVPALFAWLGGTKQSVVAEAATLRIAHGESVDTSWRAPAGLTAWGGGVPLETIRFAAVNHLLVELRYQNSWRTVEPYSLRRTQAGDLLLHAVRADNREGRSYRVDRIEGVRVTNRTFVPQYPIEFFDHGSITAPPASLNAHKTGHGQRYPGSGRRGFMV